MRVPPAALLLFALSGFAANSLLTRGAIAGGHVDPVTFMVIRLGSGALALWLLVGLRREPRTGAGSWSMAAALAAYAAFFTVAYTRIPAGLGALCLFAAVHLTMVGAGLIRGERLTPGAIAGNVSALLGLVVLTRPGLTAPDPTGVTFMAAAGVAWGLYSLAGRQSRDPLATTADNFARAVVLCLPAIFWAAPAQATPAGYTLALTSGILASGLAYAAWYAVLPGLPAWTAALVQLAVPVGAALAAVPLLGESVTPRLLAALVLVVGGIALARRPTRRG